jgi:hypothetical protein
VDIIIHSAFLYIALAFTQESIFETFHIESKHEANEILMEINLENLVQALRSAQTSDSVSVKLTKKQGTAFLTLDIEQV